MEGSRKIMVALLVGGLLAGAIILAKNSNGGFSAGLNARSVLVGVVIVVLLGVLMLKKSGKLNFNLGKGHHDKQSMAAQLGFSYEAKGDTALRLRFSDLPGIPDSGKAKHVMHGEIAARPATIFQHTYLVFTGSVVIPLSHVVLSTTAPNWPTLHLAPRPWFSRVLTKMGMRTGLTLEDAEFNRLFKVKTSDEDFALTLLSPELQQFLITKPGVTWHIKQDQLCLIYNGPLKFAKLEASIARLEQFWQLVPEELDVWGQ